mmetsp:Transcript_29834/g.86542  ORF Transcript_29834/g.86542 Transcript_29834/m.86542 type:complete len:124 (+) Transcript_29834:192-563(+)
MSSENKEGQQQGGPSVMDQIKGGAAYLGDKAQQALDAGKQAVFGSDDTKDPQGADKVKADLERKEQEAKDALEKTRQQADEQLRKMGDAANEAKDNVKDTAKGALDQAKQMIGGDKEGAGEKK